MIWERLGWWWAILFFWTFIAVFTPFAYLFVFSESWRKGADLPSSKQRRFQVHTTSWRHPHYFIWSRSALFMSSTSWPWACKLILAAGGICWTANLALCAPAGGSLQLKQLVICTSSSKAKRVCLMISDYWVSKWCNLIKYCCGHKGVLKKSTAHYCKKSSAAKEFKDVNSGEVCGGNCYSAGD